MMAQYSVSEPAKSIIYITNVPFNKRNFDRYGIAFWQAEGYRVIVMDVGYFSLPTRVPKWDHSIYRDDTFQMLIVRTKRDFLDHAPLLESAELIVDLTTAHGHSRWNLPILRAISKSGTPNIVLSVNAYPGYDMSPDVLEGFYSRARHLVSRLRAADPLNSVVARLPSRWFGLKPVTAAIYGGKKSHRRISTITPETLAIDGHHMDYDTFLDQPAEVVSENIAVFIDQDLPGHREFIDNPAFRNLDTDRYYSHLRKFFERVESKTGLEVVIAKHPHNESGHLETHMSDRRVVSGRTAELILKSQLVIGHYSAAFTIAILNRKPLLVVFSKEFIDSSVSAPVAHYPLLDALHRQCIYLEDIDRISDDALFADPLAGFDSYITDYISTDTMRREKLWPLVARTLRENRIITEPTRRQAVVKSGVME